VICPTDNTGIGRSEAEAEPTPLERGRWPGRTIPVMTENSTSENRRADPERRYSLREWLIDALALGVGGFAIFYFKPDGFVATIIICVGAYTLTHSLQGLNWVLLAEISEVLLGWLAPVIHLDTLMMVPTGTSATGLVFTFLLPGIAQAYWLWELWPATGAVSHPLTALCAAWLALVAIRIVAQIMLLGWLAPLSHHRVQMKPLPKLKRPQISNTDR